MRRLLVSLVALGTLIFGSAALLPSASAHSFGPQGPPHTHVGTGCQVTPVNCMRWILQNGAVVQGDLANLLGQQPLVLVWCSHATTATSNGNWVQTSSPWGPLGNVGATHPFCDSPVYGDNNRPWSVRGTWQTNF